MKRHVMFWLIKTSQAEIWPVEHLICKSHPQFYEAEESFKPGFRRKSGAILRFFMARSKNRILNFIQFY